MAHGIKSDDRMMYVGKKPWHGMGVELPQLATAAEAIEAANLGWTVSKEKVYAQVDGAFVEVPERFATVRSDTKRPLGVVGPQYQVLQNVDAFRFFDQLTQDPNGPKYETAGSLWHGRKIWMLAKLPDFVEVAPGDAVGQYVLLSNSHDGSSAAVAMLTPIRVVCNNTLTAATARRKGDKRFYARHSGNMMAKVEAAQDALGFVRQAFAETFELFRALAKKEPTKAEVDTILQRLIPDTKSDRATLQRDRVRELAEAGVGNAQRGVRGTAWALYNGFTELEDHVNGLGSKSPDRDDIRLNSIWFGSAATRKADALETIAEVCLS